MTMMTIDDIEEMVLEANFILGDEPQCEGENHPHSGYGHVASEPAEYALKCPKCNAVTLLCKPRVEWLLQYRDDSSYDVYCEECETLYYLTSEVLHRL